MATIRDHDGHDHEIRFRRVPGYFNRSTYHVDIDGDHVMTVRRIADASWNRSAVWAAYDPAWNVDGQQTGPTPHHLATDDGRVAVVRTALRKIHHNTPKETTPS